jgi:hypothetical protein
MGRGATVCENMLVSVDVTARRVVQGQEAASGHAACMCGVGHFHRPRAPRMHQIFLCAAMVHAPRLMCGAASSGCCTSELEYDVECACFTSTCAPQSSSAPEGHRLVARSEHPLACTVARLSSMRWTRVPMAQACTAAQALERALPLWKCWLGKKTFEIIPGAKKCKIDFPVVRCGEEERME